MNKNNNKILGASLLTAGAAFGFIGANQATAQAATTHQTVKTTNQQSARRQSKITKGKAINGKRLLKEAARRSNVAYSAKRASVFESSKEASNPANEQNAFNNFISSKRHTNKKQTKKGGYRAHNEATPSLTAAQAATSVSAENFHSMAISYNGADTRSIPWEGNHTAAVTNGVIYYYNAETNPQARSTYEAAIQKWNDLGVVKLVAQNSPKGAAIILSDNKSGNQFGQGISDYGNDDYGMTWTPNGTNTTNNVVTINPDAINKSVQAGTGDHDEMIETMEHEIGHALGFAHDQFSTTGTIDYQSEKYDANTNQVTLVHNYAKIKLAQPIMMSGRTAMDDNHGLIKLGAAEANALRAHYGANGQGLN